MRLSISACFEDTDMALLRVQIFFDQLSASEEQVRSQQLLVQRTAAREEVASAAADLACKENLEVWSILTSIVSIAV